MEEEEPTNRMDLVFNSRRKDLIPLEDLGERPATPIVAPDPAKRVRESSIWSEKALNRFLLQRWGRFDEELNDSGDFGNCALLAWAVMLLRFVCPWYIPGFSMTAVSPVVFSRRFYYNKIEYMIR